MRVRRTYGVRWGLACGAPTSLACAAALGAACAGPSQVLRESEDAAERIEAAVELRTNADKGRMEALSGALLDPDAGVREAAAATLAALGEAGRGRLIEAVGVDGTACIAARELAKHAAEDPSVAKALDPTVGRRSAGSCVVEVFEGLGAAAHGVIVEAILSDDDRRRKRGHYLACRVDPPVTDGLRDVLLGPDDGRVDQATAAMRALLERGHRLCEDRPAQAWEAVFRDPQARPRAVRAIEGYAGRADLLEPLMQVRDACVGPDALLLGMEGGYLPDVDAMAEFQAGLDAAQGNACPTVDSAPLIATLLEGGLTAGTHAEARGRVALIERLGWRPETPKARVYVSVIRGDFAEAAGMGPSAVRPIIDALRRWDLAADQRRAAFDALVRVGPPGVASIEKFLADGDAGEGELRDGLLGVAARALGPRSPRIVALAVQELERSTDEQGIVVLDSERQRHLTGLVRGAGPAGAPALAAEALKDGKPSFRSLLFSLLVEVDGRKGRTVTETAHRLLDSGRDDLVVAAAAGHLGMSNPKAARDRVLEAIRAGTLKPADVRMLAALLAGAGKKVDKALAKALKAADPVATAPLVATLGELGALELALPLAASAAKALRKASAQAVKARDNEAGIALEAKAATMEQVRDSAARGLFERCLDEAGGPKGQLKAVKALLKATKKLDLGPAAGELAKALKLASADAQDKKVAKALAKAGKKLKKK